MQNFGRGMWRRVGDYERIQKPTLLQQSRIEQWEKFIQYQTMLKQQKLRDEALAQQKQEIQSIINVEEHKPNETEEQDTQQEQEQDTINNATSDIPFVEQNTRELPVVIPKKTKRKKNHK